MWIIILCSVLKISGMIVLFQQKSCDLRRKVAYNYKNTP